MPRGDDHDEVVGIRCAPCCRGATANANTPTDPGEHPFSTHALHDINARRTAAGLEALPRLTKAVLREALEGKQVGGQAWRVGSKTKHDMVDDYRYVAVTQ